MKNVVFLFILSFMVTSCARVGSPVGGPKDTIPPQVVGSNIDTSRVKVPRNINELRIDFNEYITLKEINKNLIISPPLKRIKKILPSGMANKYLLIKWEDTLQPNTTYNFNFGNSIVDNNEGNALQYYNFAFSTGDKIDDIYLSGEAKPMIENKQAKPEEKGVVVGLYKETDSMDYRQKPYYITKADADGYYELNYLSPGNYKILAFEDTNSNSVFDPGKESVGFRKDAVVLDKSISGLNISLYPSKKAVKYMEMKEVPGGILMSFEGNPEKVEIKSLNPKLNDYKVRQTPRSDSVYVWFDAKKLNLGIDQSENLKFAYDTGVKKDSASTFYRYNTKNEMTVVNPNSNIVPPKTDFTIFSNYDVNQIQPEKWTLVSDSISQDFTAKISQSNPFEIRIHSDFKEGKKYALTVPRSTVSSYYDSLPKSYRFDFEIDKSENYGTLQLTIVHAPPHDFWLQMLNESGTVAYSHFGKSDSWTFISLKPGKYQIRMMVDNNDNGIWDAADLAHQIAAEDVFLMDKKIDIRPLWEIRETWDIDPKTDKKPTAPETTPPSAPQSTKP